MYFEFRNLTVIDEGSKLISIDKIRIYYNILDLLTGKILTSLKEIRIIKSNFNFDYQKDKDLLELFKTNSENTSSPFNLPDLIVKGKNLKIKITDPSGVVELSRLFFTLQHKGGKTKIDTKGILQISKSNSNILNGSAKFSVSGIINDQLEVVDTLVTFKSIKNKYLSSSKISLRGSYRSGIIELQKVEDSRPMDITLGYSTISKLLNIKFNTENFIPLDYFDPGDIDISVLQWLGTSITGNGKLEYSFDNLNLSYSADLSAKTNNSKIHDQATITSSLKGDNLNINFSFLKIISNKFSLNYYGNINYKNLIPSGTLFLFYNNKVAEINAKLSLQEKDNILTVKSENLKINNTNLYDFSTNITFFERDLDFETSLNLDSFKSDQKQIFLDGNIQFFPDIFLNISFTTLNMPLNPLFNIVPNKYYKYFDGLPKLTLNSSIFISTDFNRFSFSGPNIQLNNDTDDELIFSAFGNNETIEINSIMAKINNEILQGSIITNINKRSVESKIDLTYRETPYNFNVTNYTGRGIYLAGNYGLTGSLYTSGNISEFNLNLTNFPIPFKDNTSNLSISTNGYYKSASNWKANIQKLKIIDIPNLISGNILSIQGNVTEQNLKFTNIDYADSISTLAGSSVFNYNISKNKEISGNFLLQSNNGEEYKGEIDLKDKLINFYSNFTKAPLERFEKLPVSGLVSGIFNLNGTLPKPNISTTLQLERGEFFSSPLEIETSLEITENNFNIEYFRLKYMNQILQKGKGEINLVNGDFFINSEYLGGFNNKNLQSLVDINGNFEILNSRPAFSELLISNFTSIFNFNNILVDNSSSNSWNLNLNQLNQKISFFGGPKKGLSGFIDKSGEFNIISKTGLPVRGEAEGIIHDNLIDTRIKKMELDLTFFNIIPYGKFFEFISGTAFGNLDITGQLNDPLFNGNFKVMNAVSNVLMVQDKIEKFNTNINIKDRSISIGPEILNMNRSKVKIGLDLIINKWIPSAYTINIKTMDEDKIHIIYNIPRMGIEIDGYVSGNIKINQDTNSINIISDLKADNSIINLGSASNTGKDITIPLLINMKLTTGKKVQFIWPSNAIPILRATADPDREIYVTMDSLNGSYSVTGEVSIKHGSIYYFQKSFYLSEGSIIFDENESKFDPLLGFKAQIKEVDSNSELINISLIQDNLPISRFAPRFESDPPLSDVEIFSILGAGVFAQIGSEQIDLTSALLLTGDLVTQFAIIRNFETKVRDIFNLDLFSIRTQMIQNIIIDRFIENDTPEQELYLDSFGRYLDNTTLYLGKYIGDDIFLQALFQINNQTYLNNDLYTANKLLVESTLSLEWQTPLFLLGLSVKPDFIDPLSSIQNTSLELSWGYSY